MCSPKKKSHKQMNDSNKRGDYQKFDEFSSQIRDPVIESYAKKVITHVAANDGSCKQGFVKKLVDMAAEVAPALKITLDDINNKVRRIRDPPEQQQQEVLPAIPYHAIDCPTLSTTSDSSMYAGGRRPSTPRRRIRIPHRPSLPPTTTRGARRRREQRFACPRSSRGWPPGPRSRWEPPPP